MTPVHLLLISNESVGCLIFAIRGREHLTFAPMLQLKPQIRQINLLRNLAPQFGILDSKWRHTNIISIPSKSKVHVLGSQALFTQHMICTQYYCVWVWTMWCYLVSGASGFYAQWKSNASADVHMCVSAASSRTHSNLWRIMFKWSPARNPIK